MHLHLTPVYAGCGSGEASPSIRQRKHPSFKSTGHCPRCLVRCTKGSIVCRSASVTRTVTGTPSNTTHTTCVVSSPAELQLQRVVLTSESRSRRKLKDLTVRTTIFSRVRSTNYTSTTGMLWHSLALTVPAHSLLLASFSGSASPDNATAGQTWTTGCIATRVRAVGLQAAAPSAPPLLMRAHRE